jgi:hypothetical protein
MTWLGATKANERNVPPIGTAHTKRARILRFHHAGTLGMLIEQDNVAANVFFATPAGRGLDGLRDE